ncbi:hypothetical protein SCLCIDRAFT_534510 [Scleroderma citrinum Foug A]|uniref:Uncharacterized protein n=1 Tax=Scleroderma citrinum Foug A TaxID=1036808 RepID=A0A0C2ZUQ2_9AGAM|nr:hypothetical protein SCLCIDRAFT_534510 [Scleroderma citrinum Foug A]
MSLGYILHPAVDALSPLCFKFPHSSTSEVPLHSTSTLFMSSSDTEPHLLIEKCGSSRGKPIYVITKHIPLPEQQIPRQSNERDEVHGFRCRGFGLLQGTTRGVHPDPVFQRIIRCPQMHKCRLWHGVLQDKPSRQPLHRGSRTALLIPTATSGLAAFRCQVSVILVAVRLACLIPVVGATCNVYIHTSYHPFFFSPE